MVPIDRSSDTVKEIMTPVETGCLLHNFVEDVVDVLEQLDREYMPVVDSFAQCQPIGVVRQSDLRRAMEKSEDPLVSDVLIAAVPHIRADTRLNELSRLLTRAPVAIVVDGSGSLVGYLEMAIHRPRLLELNGRGRRGPGSFGCAGNR